MDFSTSKLNIRRAISSGSVTTPKSGKGRTVEMPPGLASALFDVLALRQRQALGRGWGEVPAWVFCSQAGTPTLERNLERVWYRVRRRAQKRGVRPLKLHCARHTWASLALWPRGSRRSG